MIFLTYDIHLLFLATSIGWVLARLIRFAIQKRGSLTRELTLVLLFLFLWFLIQRTMEPYILTLDRSPLLPNLVPLRGLAQMLRRAMMVGNTATWWIVAINIIGNVVGFVPVGFLVSVLTPNKHKGWISLAIGFAISLTIEILQLSFVIRVFDIDDLLLNSLARGLASSSSCSSTSSSSWGGVCPDRQSAKTRSLALCAAVRRLCRRGSRRYLLDRLRRISSNPSIML